MMMESEIVNVPFVELANSHPVGVFMAEGGYKRVYKVYNPEVNDVLAVSVMDLKQLEELDKNSMNQAEIYFGVSASKLVESKYCINFVQIMESFICHADAPKELWGSDENKKPLGTPNAKIAKAKLTKMKVSETISNYAATGKYHYISMEFCDKKDIESYLKCLYDINDEDEIECFVDENEEILMKEDEIFGMMLQMLVAMHVAHTNLKFVHLDVKNLNFFIKSPPSGIEKLKFSFDGGITSYCIPSTPGIVKLADFGTCIELPCDDSDENLNENNKSNNNNNKKKTTTNLKMTKTTRRHSHNNNNNNIGNSNNKSVSSMSNNKSTKITLTQERVRNELFASAPKILHDDHITTLENVPIDFLLLGDSSKPVAVASDMWQIGLCFVHLLMGSLPYEEVVWNCVCPRDLAKLLSKLWLSSETTYKVLAQQNEETIEILCDTLYRYVVLFSIEYDEESHFQETETGRLFIKWAAHGNNRSKIQLDLKKYSLKTGNLTPLVRARKLMNSIDGLDDILFNGLLTVNPNKRITAMNAIHHQIFSRFLTHASSSSGKSKKSNDADDKNEMIFLLLK